MLLVSCSIPILKQQVMPMIAEQFPMILSKAYSTRIPTSNTSDVEKGVIGSHSIFIKLVMTAVEELGVTFILLDKKQGNEHIVYLVDYLAN